MLTSNNLKNVATQETANQTNFESGRDCETVGAARDESEILGQRYRVSNSLRDSSVGPTSLSAQVDMIFGWLGSTEAADASSKGTLPRPDHQGGLHKSAADYENCLDLQQKLRAARCRSTGNLCADEVPRPAAVGSVEAATQVVLSPFQTSPSSSSPVPTQTTDSPDDDDYAASSDANGPGSSESDLTDSKLSSDELKASLRAGGRSAKARKEITLRVVVDEAQKSGGDVFFIDPSVSF